MDTRAIEYVAGLIFLAGGAYAQFRRMRRDVNGVGRKLNEHMRKSDIDRERAMLISILLAPAERREELLWRYWEGLK